MRTVGRAFLIMFLMAFSVMAGMFLDRNVGTKATLMWLMNIPGDPTEDQIENAIGKLLRQGRASELYEFYAPYVGGPQEAAYWTSGAIQGKWKVARVMALVWVEKAYGSKGRQSPAQLQTVTAQDADGPISMADYMRSEQEAEKSVNRSVDLPLQVDNLIRALRMEWIMNRKFVLRFPDAVDW
jgi:hypothetical protein